MAQPLFDVLAKAPDFFVSRGAGAGDVLLVAAALSIGLPTALVAVEALVGALGRWPRRALHLLLVGVLAFVFVLPVLNRAAVSTDLTRLGIGAGVGAGFALLYALSGTMRRFCTFLTLTVPIFPALFLFHSPVTTIVLPSGQAPLERGRGAAPIPIVMVVFDEFSLPALLDAGRAIDAARFPNLAALAREGTWYRNATTVASVTQAALPAILTGRRPVRYPLGDPANFGSNLFTLLSGSHALHVVESFAPFCPADLCAPGSQRGAGERLAGIATDLLGSFRRMVSPPSLLDLELLGVATAHRNAPLDQRAQLLERFIAAIGSGDRPTLHFLHILLPHDPLVHLPSGRLCLPTPYVDPVAWGPSPLHPARSYERYRLQLEYVDREIGALVARLKATGLYDASLLVVTGDHGVSHRPGSPRRAITRANLCEILSVPLLVKLPHQRVGGIDDRNVELIDLLPTIADALHVTVPWRVDGGSLLDPTVAPRASKVIRGPYWEVERDLFGSGDEFALDSTLDPACFALPPAIAAVLTSERRALVGQPVTALRTARPPAPVRVTLEPPGARPTMAGAPLLPCTVTGHLVDPAGGRGGVDLAVAVDGVIAAVTRTEVDASFAATIPEDALRSRDDRVEIYVIQTDGGAPALVPADVVAPAGARASSHERSARRWADPGTARLPGRIDEPGSPSIGHLVLRHPGHD